VRCFAAGRQLICEGRSFVRKERFSAVYSGIEHPRSSRRPRRLAAVRKKPSSTTKTGETET
jgi:hypothetical protein